MERNPDKHAFEPSLPGRVWPLGPLYRTAFEQAGIVTCPWAEFKLLSAEWYLETLRLVHNEIRDLDRLVGVEMALDGVLSAASSAFDAAITCLIIALEDKRGISEGDRTRRRNWKAAKRIADKPPAIELTCRTAVDVALTGEDDDLPSGWLAQLRHLRNRSTHEETLSRGLQRGADDDQTRLRVPGLGEVEPISYLGASLVHSRGLTRQLLTDVDAINL